MSEGFYPDPEWPGFPEIEQCDATHKHEPHFWIPTFLDENQPAPDFVCGGRPRKIIHIDGGL